MYMITEQISKMPPKPKTAEGRRDQKAMINEVDLQLASTINAWISTRSQKDAEDIRILVRQAESLITTELDVLKLQSLPLLIQLLIKSLIPNLTNEPVFWLQAAIEQEFNEVTLALLQSNIVMWTHIRTQRSEAALVNSMFFPEWVESGNEAFLTKHEFTDIDGDMKLSSLQRSRFVAWKRPAVMFKKPLLISDAEGSVANADIRQSGCVPNCSLISSLLIMSQREAVKPGFATSVLYPKGKSGVPVLSPNGRHHVKLFWNGAYRIVCVDDRLPVDSNNRLLCAQSAVEGELWPTIIEKAYLKLVAGGYDLWTGSNSGIDIYALTGWPPESLILEPPTNLSPARLKPFRDDIWTKLIRAMKIKDNLITACTRSDLNEEASGMPRGHAFAVLNAREENGCRKLLLRNPWARNSDGFWIALEDMPKHFRSAHINWNLNLFSHVSHHMCTLPPNEKPKNVGFLHNIQYRVRVAPGTKLVWVLLSRHIHAVSQLESAEEAVACHAFVTSQRVTFPDKEVVAFKGQYGSSPHALCRVERISDDGTFVLVLSTLSPKKPVPSTLSVFSTSAETKVEELLPTYLGETMTAQVPWDQQCNIWTLKLPSTRCPLLGSKIRLRLNSYPVDDSMDAVDFSLLVLDVKLLQRTKLGVSQCALEGKPLRVLEVTIPEAFLARSSVRFAVVAHRKSAADATGDFGTGPSEQIAALKYALEVDCDLPLVQLIAPQARDSQQQLILRKMIDTFKEVGAQTSRNQEIELH